VHHRPSPITQRATDTRHSFHLARDGRKPTVDCANVANAARTRPCFAALITRATRTPNRQHRALARRMRAMAFASGITTRD
jgi:hypothetical protein